MAWVKPEELVVVAGSSIQAVRKALRRAGHGIPWRGANLKVRTVHGVGGRSGISYQVALDSLPYALQLRFKELESGLEHRLKRGEEAQNERALKAAILQPLLNLPPYSKERGDAILAMAANPPIGPDGLPLPLTIRKLYRWLGRLERQGIEALSKAQRQDKGVKRVIVTRNFDKAALAHGVADQQLIQIGSDLRSYAAGLISKGASKKILMQLLKVWLTEVATILNLPPDTDCHCPSYIAQELRDYRKVAIFRKDRKTYEDARPRISRTVAGLLPMDVIIGDVKFVDILAQRGDGSIVTPRMISWLDLATKRLHVTFFLLPKGEGIRNEHVIASFLAMVRDWGAPRGLYLDNGSEYNWAPFIEDALHLLNGKGARALQEVDHWQNRSSRIIRAQAYNAAAKPIEGVFRVLERSYFCHVPGWIGGDRMRKKSANVGKAPEPFPGSFEDLQALLFQYIGLYNSMPQSGQIKGRAPNAAYAEFLAKGWSKIAVEEDAFRMAFSIEETRIVRQGAIEFRGQRYTCRELQAYQGRSVTVMAPKYEDWARLPLKNEKGKVFAFAEPDKPYSYLDAAGAVEGKTRAVVHREALQELEASVPALDLHAEIKKVVRLFPPAPEAPVGDRLLASDKARALLTAIDETPDAKALREAQEATERQSRQLARPERSLGKDRTQS